MSREFVDISREFIDIYNKVSNEKYNEENKNDLNFNAKRKIIEEENDNTWNYYYNLAQVYSKHYGNLEIPYNFKTINGYEYDEQCVKLGSWISTQRRAYKEQGLCRITEEQKKLLKEIKISLNVYNDNWQKNYNLAKSYHDYHGNLNIPQSFKTTNGYEYDAQGVKLGIWIHTQRMAYKGQGTNKITEEQIKLLEEIGMQFDNVNANFERWMKNYNLAKIYYEHHGNLNIPQSFKTKNGYEYDEQGVKLGGWINNQRVAYKGLGTYKITEEQIKLLEEIGINWFNYKTDPKLQNEVINEKNKNKKQIEILNRLKSYLNTLDENKVYSKEEINSGFVKKLNGIIK